MNRYNRNRRNHTFPVLQLGQPKGTKQEMTTTDEQLEPSASDAPFGMPAALWSHLQSLGKSGKLLNTPPVLLALLWVAAGRNVSGTINDSGYGGYFGLHSGTAYPTSTGSSRVPDMTGTSTTAFGSQAEAAAAEFKEILKTGNPRKIIEALLISLAESTEYMTAAMAELEYEQQQRHDQLDGGNNG